jgi:hypothetical protein
MTCANKPYLTAFKYNINVREIPNTGKTWIIYEDFLNKGVSNPVFIDHIETRGNLQTYEKTYPELGGFGMAVEGPVSFDLNELTGNRYAIIGNDKKLDQFTDKEEADKLKNPNILRGYKYHVPSRGILGNNNIWRIYIDILNGVSETLYVEHLEFRGVSGYTGENLHRIGYAHFSKGAITVETNESGLKTAIIHTGELDD